MKTTLMLVGGFLGAGKTTLLLHSARQLQAQGHTVAIVTNDQGSDLVDTALARGQGVPVTEVIGGCFCCRFHDFIAAVEAVRAAAEPEIILAEPVGSCTDLVSTVLRPLHTRYPDQFNLAAFTVLLDPNRSLTSFPATVSDLYRWQTEEADIIALNKIDLLGETEAARQIKHLSQTYPGKTVVGVSARTGAGVGEWLALALRQAPSFRSLIPIDYITYAAAEAALGWLNAAGTVQGGQPFSMRAWGSALLSTLQADLRLQDAEIAHLKIHLRSDAGEVKGSLTSLSGDSVWASEYDGAVSEARLILNARVRCEPAALQAAVERSAAQLGERTGAAVAFEHVECFSPAPPQPTFRITDSMGI
jgi:Ni2+-binding GTPase involved in maturation of urease and hydrogenase